MISAWPTVDGEGVPLWPLAVTWTKEAERKDVDNVAALEAGEARAKIVKVSRHW